MGQHEPCCNSAELLIFSYGFKSSVGCLERLAERLKGSAVCFTQALGRVFRYRDFMKIWSVKTTVYSLEPSVINLFNLYFINNTCTYSLRNWASYIPICYLSYLCKITKSWFNNQCLKKKKKAEKRERDLNWMKNFKIESRYLKFRNEFRAVIICMKAAFYRPDYQNSYCVRWSKDSTEHFFQNMRPALWKAQLSFWNIQPSFWGFKRKLKARSNVWKARPRVCLVTRPIPSQSATVKKPFFTVR